MTGSDPARRSEATPNRARPATERRRALTWVLVALVAAALCAVVHLIAVRTLPGQRIDDVAMQGRKATDLGARRAATAAMRVGTPALVVVFVPAAVAVAWRRGRALAGVVVAGAVVLTVAVARWSKDALPRVDLLGDAWVAPDNTFPSGHSAAAMAVALASVALSPRVRRRPVAAVAAVAVAVHSTAMLGSGWHRPSDVLGGFALAVTAMALSFAVLHGTRQEDCRVDAPGARRGPAPAWWVEVATLAAVAAVLLVLRNRSPNPDHPFVAFFGAVLLVDAVAMGCVRAVAVLVDRGIRRDQPSAAPAGAGNSRENT